MVNSPISAFAVYQQRTSKNKPNKNHKQISNNKGNGSFVKRLKKEKNKLKKTATSGENSSILKVQKAHTTHKYDDKIISDTKRKQEPVLKNPKKVKTNEKKKTSKVIVKKNKKTKVQKKVATSLKQNGNKYCDKDEPPLLIPKVDVQCEHNEQVFVNTDNPDKDASNALRWFISSVSPRKFFSKYWEKDVLYVHRNQPDYYSGILSTDQLDSILRENSLHYTRNVDVVSYENGVKELHNLEGRAVPAALWDYYLNGCSIRILNPQTYASSVRILISNLQEYFGTMVGANVYLTPPASQGFAPHYDDIEAFIVQLEGRKHWKLYKPKGSDVLARNSSPNLNADNIGDPFMEVTVNAGDLLYFPRGTIHEGRTDPDSHSLHITISVYQHTAYVDLLEKIVPNALKKASECEVEFRKGLPINYLKYVGCVNKHSKTEIRREILHRTKDLMKTLINYIDIDLAADELGRKFMYDAMPPVLTKGENQCTSKYDGDYMKNGKVFNRVEISLDTRIRLLRYHCLRVVNESNTPPKLYYCTDNAKVYHGEEEQWLEIDEKLLAGIQMLQHEFPKFITVEHLPIEDVMGKIQMVADLWEKGLLVTEQPLEPLSDVEDDSSSVISDVSL